MQRILISSFDLAIGGIERSLLGLLGSIDYQRYAVDLMLFRHEGELFPLLPPGPRLLPEVTQYATFRQPIAQIVREGYPGIACCRLLARYLGAFSGRRQGCKEIGYFSMQYGWLLALPLLPPLKTNYDVAISFMWPHYFVSEKVNAAKKVGWIHTDYASIQVNTCQDLACWRKFDRIIAVSESCRESFVHTYPQLADRTTVIENILHPERIHRQAADPIGDAMPARPGQTRLLSVGRYSYAKGFDDAIRACKLLIDRGHDIVWYLLGYGGDEIIYRQLITEFRLEDRFVLLGKTINPYPYINACDIYVQPSRYEGKAVTVREAQILGKPVLITDFPTARSQVRDGVDALVTTQGPEGIAAGVQRLLGDVTLCTRLCANTYGIDYSNRGEMTKLYDLLDFNNSDRLLSQLYTPCGTNEILPRNIEVSKR